MDVLEIYENLDDDPDAQRAFEQLLLRSVQASLDECRWVLDEASERERELRRALDSEEAGDEETGIHGEGESQRWSTDEDTDELQEKQEEIRRYTAHREDLLRLIAAIAGRGGGSDPDDFIDSAAIEKTIQDRRVRQAAAQGDETLSAQASTASRNVVDLERGRRGRPAVYRWKEFAAEMARRCTEGPIADQATLERHMQQWCADKWGNEPATSQIRDWVGPTFKATVRPLSMADKSEEGRKILRRAD